MTPPGREDQFAAGKSGSSAGATPAASVGWLVPNAERSLAVPTRVSLLAARAVAHPPNLYARSQSEADLSRASSSDRCRPQPAVRERQVPGSPLSRAKCASLVRTCALPGISPSCLLTG
jgi:hypothetical protein